MKNLGSVGKFPELSKIYHAIAFGKVGDTVFPPNPPALGLKVDQFHGKKLNYVDWKGVRYVQQNPNTQSAYAARARQGSRIVWVIRLRDGAYMGCIENGEVFLKGEYLSTQGR